jgi:DNA mismatch repair protein MutL
MSDVIHLLPDSVANQIAAGEVIQRPASVIKELVENAIDAGAANIEILLTDAGKTCIQVIDDGKGMSGTDARLAFERHATSKIRQAADLFSLTTMGFRGEALPSIAAVAQVELRTRREEDELGTSIHIAGSKIERQEPVSCPRGANFMVKNLFFNVPARRKFLKTNQTELNNILTEIDRIVLVHPEVSFVVHHNDNELYRLPATSLRMRLMNVFGKKVSDQLLALDVDTSLVKVTGYVARPESSKKKGANQFFFVNGRYMRHPYFHRAVMEAYEQLIPAGEQVAYFIYMEVEPASIDVNIHPTKTEIKFENEQAIWQILAAGVKESLGRYGGVPSIDFDTEGMPDIPSAGSVDTPFVQPPQVKYNPNFNPFDNVVDDEVPSFSQRGESSYRSASSAWNGGGASAGYQRSSIDWESLYQGVKPSDTLPVGDEITSTLFSAESSYDVVESAMNTVSKAESHYQFKGRYIATSVKSGLMIIDQHRAHIRVLYDRYMAQLQGRSGASQGLLFPELLQLTVAEDAMLQTLLPDLLSLGFDVTSLGGGSWSVSAIPAGTEGLDASALLQQMIASAIEREGAGQAGEEVRTAIALSLARSSAIVYGQLLTAAEMDELVASLFASSSPNHTPDGLTVLSVITMDELEKRF